jgi:F-type H+-transporting ATPase subunit delta
MATNAKQYARGLYEALVGQSAAEVKVVLKNFVALLGRRRELAKSEEILVRFSEIWNQEKGELDAELASARELGPTAKEAVIDYLKNKTGAKSVRLQESVQPELIGGFILRYDGRIVDGSLLNNLQALKNKISN